MLVVIFFGLQTYGNPREVSGKDSGIDLSQAEGAFLVVEVEGEDAEDSHTSDYAKCDSGLSHMV